LDNGDMIQGSPLSYYHAKFAQEAPSPIIETANLLQYDAAVLGNHEFNYGQTYLKRMIEQARFPWLSANICDITGDPAFGPPYIIKEIEGVRIAILGLTTHHIPN